MVKGFTAVWKVEVRPSKKDVPVQVRLIPPLLFLFFSFSFEYLGIVHEVGDGSIIGLQA
ncbi:hypothetical protein ATG71_1132 [Bacillus sp. es.034]|nr:hypothetical protein ATG71_1132 [Bacillus sp. es.034]